MDRARACLPGPGEVFWRRGGAGFAANLRPGRAIELDDFVGIVLLSLAVSASATVIAGVIGLPAGAALAVYRFPGRRMLVIVVNALFGLPPVVVGLALYLALSHSGPLGFLHALFTPAAMVAAQAILAAPIIIGLTHRAAERAWARYGDALRIDGASRLRATPHVIAIVRAEVMTAVLAGFGRTISEVGAIILVGGNIRGLTSNHDYSDCAANEPGLPPAGRRPGRGAGWHQHCRQRRGVFTRGKCAGSRPGRGALMVVMTSIPRMPLWPFAAVLFAVGPLIAAHAQAADNTIVLASTTSVENSGLLARILPQFTEKTGIVVRVVAQGTGQALDTARRGDADLVLVHDPEAEAKFVGDGDGLTPRQIAWNDFVILGPANDPAHVKGGHDAVAALKAIGNAAAAFVSRGDGSGTNAMELRLWKEAGEAPGKHVDGSWYRDIGGGMGQALNAASAMQAYTLSDRGTWLSFADKTSLVIEVEGDPRLINRYDVIELNPNKHAQAKIGAARILAEWLASPEGQRAIGSFQVGGQQLFHPSASNPK